MKYFFSLLMFAFVFTGYAQTVDDAIDWNDQIVTTQTVMLTFEDALVEVLAEGMPGGIVDIVYESYINYIDYSIKYYKAEDPFDSQDIFRKAILDLLADFKKIAETEYAELVELNNKPIEDLTDDDFERWDYLANRLDELEIESNADFLEAQQAFADQYGFSLGD
ncbi:MAG: hypothetical protein C0592_06965 [Marinilabiliales bacterium]|nr:MAG: hypothetical protein C0592_06965 [Marinilabiliales bacterium]